MAVANIHTLVYNGVTIDPVTFYEEKATPEMSADNRQVLAYNVQVVIEGFFLNVNTAGMVVDIDAVLAAFTESAVSSGSSFVLNRRGVPYRTFAAADFLGGGPHPTYEFLQTPKRAGFGVPVRIIITGKTRPTGGSSTVISDTFADTLKLDKQCRGTFTRTGQLIAPSGVSAGDQFDDQDPKDDNTSPPGQDDTFEFETSSKRTDKDDEVLDYEFVYIQHHESNPTSAADVTYSVTRAIENGTEVWTIDGEIKWKEGEEIDDSEIGNVVQASNFPSALSSITENVVQNDRTNSLRFTIRGEQGFGGGEFKGWTESVRTVTDPFESIHKSLDGGSPDVKQVNGRATVQITQSGSAIGTTRHPTAPVSLLLPGKNVTVRPDVQFVSPDLDASGKPIEYVTTWTYNITQYNAVSIGQFPIPIKPTASPMLNQAASTVVNPNT